MSAEATPAKRFALFAYGFRPFFLLAGWYAILSVLAWLWLYRSGISPLPGLPAQFWHGHEMLFGFVGAAVAGFLLTAVPSWTGSRGFAGWPLAALTLVWILGRVAFALGGRVPPGVLAVAELAFVPALLVLVAPPVMRTANRNLPVLFVLATFWCFDAVFLWAVQQADAVLARQMLLATLSLVLLLITVIAGRIVPAFTGNALRARGVAVSLRTRPLIERLTVAAMAALVLADLVRLPAGAAAAVAGLAAVLHGLRMSGWQTHRTFKDPLVWILHAAYLWIPAGLALRALHTLGGFGFAAHWLHALGTGAAATMILAVMSRAALGHTGRALRAAPAIVGSYVLLIAAGILRVFGAGLLPMAYESTIVLSTIAWTVAFLLFAFVYTPILVRPRADGRPG